MNVANENFVNTRTVVLLIACLMVFLNGCKKDGDTNAQRSQNEERPTADSAESAVEEAKPSSEKDVDLPEGFPFTEEQLEASKEEMKDEQYRKEEFTPIVIWARDYEIRLEGEIIGKGRIEVEEWHHGRTHVTNIQKWYFPDEDIYHGVRKWSQQSYSETGGFPIRWWGRSSEEGFSRVFDIKPTDDYTEISWKRTGDKQTGGTWKLKTDKRPKLVERLYRAFAQNLRSTEDSLAIDVVNWLYAKKPSLVRLQFTRIGEETLEVKDGQAIGTVKLAIETEGIDRGVWTLWVDKDGYPVKWENKAFGLEMMAVGKRYADDVKVGLTWAQAQKKWNFSPELSIYENLYALKHPEKTR